MYHRKPRGWIAGQEIRTSEVVSILQMHHRVLAVLLRQVDAACMLYLALSPDAVSAR
jgi:hypothetical protein